MKSTTQILLFITMSFCWFGCNTQKEEKEETKNPKTVIAFGSCSRENMEEQLWDEIANEDPQLMIMLGDNIYGDSHDMAVLREKYQQQKNRPSYQNLLNTTEVIGVWDDHDYGVNDGGKYFVKKDSSKALMLDFLDVPDDDPVRSRKGAYSSYILNDSEHTIKVILLDTRYFRDTLQADPSGESRYLPNPEGDILGEEQWTWLESELKDSDADMHIIGSSIQIIAKDHGFEKWANFPKARNRFFQLVGKHSPKNTLVISGDRHIAEISSMEIDGLNYPLYDFTASGLTHTWEEHWEENNEFRIGNLIIEKNYGLVTVDWGKSGVEFAVKGKEKELFLTHTIDIE